MIYIDNLKIAVRSTENGQIVYYKNPDYSDDGEDFEGTRHQHSFENCRDPKFGSNDWYRCLHYHLGEIIDSTARDILKVGGDYDIEVIITPKKK